MTTPSIPTTVRYSRTLRVPREGRLWLLAGGVLLATGVFKGINLVVLLACLLIATWVVNAVGARRNLRGLAVRRRVGRAVFAGVPARRTIEVARAGKGLAVGLRVEDAGPPHQGWYIPSLAGGQTAVRTDPITWPRRGRHPWEAPRVRSAFPFGLAEAAVRPRAPGSVVVFPALGRLHADRFRRFLSQAAPEPGLARRPVRRPAAQSEVHGVRPFRSGDSPRWIHWRTTARRGELMVREFEERPADHLIVVLEPRLSAPAGGPAAPSPALEAALSLAATVCWEWCQRPGDRLALAVADRPPVVFAGRTGGDYALRLLECLALQGGSAEPDVDGLLDRLAAERLPPAPVLLVSTQPASFAGRLAARLGRPVGFVNAAALAAYDFYEGPAAHAP
jgi:uncharacterized protein (DUF58 family)